MSRVLRKAPTRPVLTIGSLIHLKALSVHGVGQGPGFLFSHRCTQFLDKLPKTCACWAAQGPLTKTRGPHTCGSTQGFPRASVHASLCPSATTTLSCLVLQRVFQSGRFNPPALCFSKGSRLSSGAPWFPISFTIGTGVTAKPVLNVTHGGRPSSAPPPSGPSAAHTCTRRRFPVSNTEVWHVQARGRCATALLLPHSWLRLQLRQST